MPDKLQRAIAAIKAGDKETCKGLLIEALKEDRRNENAWLWMTQVVSTKDERIKCLQNVLKINPDNEKAKRGLAKLKQAETQSPPKLTSLSQPPKLEQQAPTKQQSETKKQKPALPILVTILLVACVGLCCVPYAVGELFISDVSEPRVERRATFELPEPTPKPTPTVKPLGWTGNATEYSFHSFKTGRRGTYLGGVLLDGGGHIEVYLGHDQDIDNLELVADCDSYDEEGCGVGFVLDLWEGDHFFEVISDGPYTLVLERK